MASKQAQEFPVRVTKGTGKDKVTRTAHSPIAFEQLKTEGFKVEGKEQKQSQAPDQPQAASPKSAGK